jgi:hypothetical protein
MWRGVYVVQIQGTECRNLIKTGQRPLDIMAEVIPQVIYIILNRRVNFHSKYTDGLYNSMIDDKDVHITSPLIMFTCTVMRHAVLVWQMNKGVHSNTSQSKQIAGTPDCLNYVPYNNGAGKTTSWCTATGRKLFTSPSIADTYVLLLNAWII